MPRTVTLPFFLEQVHFKDKNLIEKAKYKLFFVTAVIKLRTDGMEPRVIVERLQDRAVPIDPRKKEEIIDEIKEEFDKSVAKGELKYHSRTKENGTIDPHAAYGFTAEESKKPYFDELAKGLQVFISYTRSFESRAKRVYDILRAIGITPWLDIHQYGRSIQQNISKGINDSCLVVLLLTDDYRYQGLIKAEIDQALVRYDSTSGSHFDILPIIILDGIDERKFVPLINERGPDSIRSRGIVYQWAKDDADIIGHVVKTVPVRLGITEWR